MSQNASSLDALFGAVSARPDGSEVMAALKAAARERILVLDGAMGTQIQGLGFDEDHFRGDKFTGCACHQQGNNDLLILTQPKAIEEIHYKYAKAGADIIETNTFSSTSIAQADYGMEDMVYELNRDGARPARIGYLHVGLPYPGVARSSVRREPVHAKRRTAGRQPQERTAVEQRAAAAPGPGGAPLPPLWPSLCVDASRRRPARGRRPQRPQ